MRFGLAGAGAVACALTLAGSGAAVPAASRSTPSLGVYPVPKSVVVRHGSIRVSGRVSLVASASADPAAVADVRRSLEASGATIGGRRGGLTVVVGRDPAVERALQAPLPTRLPSGGYTLAAGLVGRRPMLVLDGVDARGAYYAAQTLRQLLDGRHALPAMVIRDWPTFGTRGVVEGFYGPRWSEAATVGMVDFLAEHKLDTFMYLPKDDPFVRGSWRSPYSPQELGLIASLVRRAARDHVTLNVGISPGDTICYSSAADYEALRSKLATLWRVGVHAFTLAFDDIKPGKPCAGDAAAFGTGADALGRAQTTLVNRIEDALVRAHPGIAPLTVVPTEYAGTAPSTYRATLARDLRSKVVLEWTGPYTVSTSIPTDQAVGVRKVFGHRLVIWDNYFVTDYLPGSLVLGPYDGRTASLATAAEGIVANPMNEPELSKIGLFTVADFAWNPGAYDATRSLEASVREYAHGNRSIAAALAELADTNATPAVGSGQAPGLLAAVSGFWTRWNARDRHAAVALHARLVALQNASATLQARLAGSEFVTEAQPWLDSTRLWTQAAILALNSLVDHRAGRLNREAAEQAQARTLRAQALGLVVQGWTPPASVRIAGGLLDDFVHNALRGYGP